MKKVNAHILVPERVIQRYFITKPLAYALQESVVKEIERLQAADTIVPVTHSEWAASIVSIVETNGSIRIWVGYKVKRKSSLKLDNYSIPETENLLTKIGGDQKFTKLDLSSLPTGVTIWRKQHVYNNKYI